MNDVSHRQPSIEAATHAQAQALRKRLRAQIAGEVRFDAGSRALYAADASNYRQLPIGVVIPRTIDDVIAAVAVCREFGAPVLARGGGTSLAGQCCNVAVVIDMSKHLNKVIDIDPGRRLARVQPGVILDDLRAGAARHGLTFGPDPATHNHNTLAGMIGNNSCGIHSVLAEQMGTGARTSDNLVALDVLTYDGERLRVGQDAERLEAVIRAGGRAGEIYSRLRHLRDRYADAIRARYPRIPRRVSGYNLPELLSEKGFHVARALAGSEGTCATILEATVQLIPNPPARTLVVLGYPDVYHAGDHVSEILEFGPVGLEGIDDLLIQDMQAKDLHLKNLRLLPEGKGWLLVEFGGQTRAESEAKARAMLHALAARQNAPASEIYTDPQREQRVWEIRESGLGATAFVPGESPTWPGWEDAAVPPEKLGGYLRDFRHLLERHDYRCDLYGHFGQGCVHVRIDFDLQTPSGIAKYRAFVQEAAELVVRYGGSFSGEHGDGQSRAELLPKLYGTELMQAFREFKAIWDPDGKMNPGKLVDARRVDSDLRLGPDYAPARPATHFRFPHDEGSFGRAVERCVGVGKCRKLDSGTMCPSYMATREEMHSTRGRAHLLFEMLNKGEPVDGGWRDEHVRAALDLCLACKGCKRECPVNVDMASYKAEFLSHYYAGRRRPRAAYVMGLIYQWSRLASAAPGLANFLTQTPGLGAIAKRVAGFAPARRIPTYAGRTFTHWFHRRPPRDGARPAVVLWPDTFTNHFHPRSALAAVEVLEDAGYRVIVPRRFVCCGLPLFYYGMLDRARARLRDVLDTLRPEIEAGIPVVGLEPSCTGVFRDELLNFFPDDPLAQRLSAQTRLLSEFFAQEARAYRLPQMTGKAIVHGHCHHKAIFRLDAEEHVLRAMGLDVRVLDSGCCGMAGAFGFERAHYPVAMRIGERVLLPAVREADADTLIVADGFSCREQIAQSSERRALHLADVMRMALGQARVPAPRPESALVMAEREDRARARTRFIGTTLAGAGAALALGALLAPKVPR